MPLSLLTISEFMAPSVDPASVVRSWKEHLAGLPLQAQVVPGANHKVDDSHAQAVVCLSLIHI